jgi:sigma-B regulation protein RsbU (phosphoserine phosphatase)
MVDAGATGHPGLRARQGRRKAPALATLAEIGRAILQAELDQDALCELIYRLAGRIVPTDTFQLGLFDGDSYQIKVWVREGQRQTPAVFTVPEGQGIIGWLRSSHQPLLVHDFQSEMGNLPARPIYLNDEPPRSAVFLPMLVADTVIGAISIQSCEPNAFNDSHVRLLSILANQSASALNNARLYARDQRQLNDLKAVAEVGRKLTSILDLDELLTQVVELIQSRFGYYHVQIVLVEQGSDRAIFKASSGHKLSEKWREEGRSARVGQEGIIGWVAQHGEALLANDVTQEPRYIPDDPRLLPDTRAELAVPLVLEGVTVGVLDVQSTQLDAFGQEDSFILRTLADQVAVAVNSARAYEAQREEAWVTTVLLQVAEATSQADDTSSALEAAVRVTAMLAGVESTSIWLWNEEHECFDFAASFGLPMDEASHPDLDLRFLPGDWPALDRVREDRAAVVIGHGAPDLPARLASICPGDRVALLPLLNQSQVFGVMGASLFAEQAPAMDERRLTMLSGIAHQVAAAVNNGRLTAALEEEVWTSTVLLQVAEAIRRLQPVETTLEQVTRLAPALTGVDRCAALLLDGDGNYLVRTVHAPKPELAEAYTDAVIRPGDLPLLDDACRLGQPLVVSDTAGSPRVPDAWCERFGSRTILVVPLLVADEPIGALLADDVDATHMFSPRRVRILSGIANQAAIAIENARLQVQEAGRARLNRELELAHDIQRSLLPSDAPCLPGYQIAYRWRAAREVGGDFFDFIPLAPDRLGLVIADVSDKGIPAALYMMFARTLMRASALSGREPAAALLRTNELILADSTSDMFVTACYGVLDAAGHKLTYASAGHNLALHAPAGGCASEPMVTGGIALGIIAEAEIEQKTLELSPGDVFLLYTDGVIETLNPTEEEFGEERLAGVLCAHRDEPAEAIADAIDVAVRGFARDAAQYDDFTLILVKRVG